MEGVSVNSLFVGTRGVEAKHFSCDCFSDRGLSDATRVNESMENTQLLLM